MYAKEKNQLKVTSKRLEEDIHKHIVWLSRVIGGLDEQFDMRIKSTPLFCKKEKSFKASKGKVQRIHECYWQRFLKQITCTDERSQLYVGYVEEK